MDLKPTAEDNPIRILIIDEESLVRAAFRKLVESWRGFNVVGEVERSDEAVSLLEALHPDVVLFTLPGEDDVALDRLGDLVRASQCARILVLMGEDTRDLRIRTVKLGARGVVLKQKAPQELRKAIEKVHRGEIWMDRASLTILLTDALQPAQNRKIPEESPLGALSERELEVANLVAKGLTNKEVGGQLFISETTVRHHLTTIFNKLKVSNRFELITYIFQHVPARRGSVRARE